MEINYFLRKAKANSSPGLDKVMYPILQQIMAADPRLLPKIFNSLLRKGHFPKQWKTAKWIPIPKLEQSDLTDPANIRPILLLSYAGKLYEKILTARDAEAGKAMGAISDTHMGSRENIPAMDTLMATLTPAQEWLNWPPKINKRSKGPDPPRPTIMTNDIAGAFNCVITKTLRRIMENFKMPRYLIKAVSSFTTGRSVAIFLEGKLEQLSPISAGLPQLSPLSPVLCILYASALSEVHATLMAGETCYVDDAVLLQEATSTTLARSVMQERIDRKLTRAKELNVMYAPGKSELMHLIPKTNKLKPNEPGQGITMGPLVIQPSLAIKSLGILIDHRLSFRSHIAGASVKAAN